jgi:uncharacterized Zn-finger protein
MNQNSTKPEFFENPVNEYFIKKAALPISCPTKDMPLWSAHPRVYLPLSEKEPEVVCPYCGTKFILAD